MSMKIYHNPKCSKSRETLQLLHKQGYKPEIIFYLEKPPTKAQLREIITKLDRNVDALIRKGEDEYKAHFTAVDLSDEATLIDLLIAYPKVIERPIVVSETGAVIGRPPEAVSVLF